MTKFTIGLSEVEEQVLNDFLTVRKCKSPYNQKENILYLLINSKTKKDMIITEDVYNTLLLLAE